MSAKEFKQSLDQIATPSSSSEPQWDAITNIVELIKQREVSAKKASQDIRKKLLEANESTVLQTLYLVDSIIKNTPAPIHKDFLTTELLGAFKAIVEGQGPSMAKAVDKALEMLGEWKAAFGDDSGYKAVQTTFNDLEKGGYFIPEATLASASYMQKPPPFQEADKCYLCSKEFGKSFIKGRHHCRNCGKSICSKCTGETNVPLPNFGIKEPQRVCITCHKKIDKPSEQNDSSSNLPQEYMHLLGGDGGRSDTSPAPPTAPQVGGSGQQLQLQEEEDLQMAIAMSLNEEENKKSSKTTPTSVPQTVASQPPPQATPYTPIYADLDFSNSTPTQQFDQQARDDELQRYLNYGRQQKEVNSSQTVTNPSQSDVSVPLCETLRNLIDRFVQRMQNLNDKGTSIATDQAVLTLHQDLTAMNIQLLQQMDETQDKKAHMESILHKLEEAKEARVTLDTMRRRHQEQLLQQEREQAALAQMQVQMKLALLRQQKAEQLAYGQSMQAERLGRLSNQRDEYERTLASQREMERSHLIAQEQHVYQQQFGTTTDVNPYSVPSSSQGPPPSLPDANYPYSVPPSSVGYGGSPPLIHAPAVGGPLPQGEPQPPPYQPIPSLYQPSLYQPPPPQDTIEYHTPVAPSGPPPTDVPPLGHQYAPPPSFATPTPMSTNVPSSFAGLPPQLNPTHQVPLMTGLPSVPPPSLLQRPPSEPPLISFD